MCILETEFICINLRKQEAVALFIATGLDRDMDCKEFEKWIPDFISDKMNYATMKGFCRHMEYCEDCREELNIQFLVSESLQHLEDGRAFDLQRELNHRLEQSRRSVRLQDTFMRIGIILEIVAVGLLAGCILWILL